MERSTAGKSSDSRKRWSGRGSEKTIVRRGYECETAGWEGTYMVTCLRV